ncbi:SDR family NAD(P)-dependent oxidoreductase [Roseibium sp.]|uniref:SDR family NAD(P)-dependent oxidoreductase n=1 Tax=Roseibium sp. TaxID=1936156 RepID=UPI003A977399
MTCEFVATPDTGIAWITGASSGIGRALALRLADEGWTIAATARSVEKLRKLEILGMSTRGKIHAYPGDVTDRDAMRELALRIETEAGPLALLVPNAGVYFPQDGLSGNPDEWQKSFDVNLSGTVNVLLPSIDAMKARGRGQIAIVASVAGYRGLPTSAAYGATKAGLINMAEALKFDLDRANIRIQVINPGFVDTPATADNPFDMPQLIQPEEAAEEIARGLKDKKAFEIFFPKGFVRQLKVMRILPHSWYFRLIAKSTGWDKKPKVGRD